MAPRFKQRIDRQEDERYLSRIDREFPFHGEMYRVTVSPARITGSDNKERDELPGDREAIVEDVIRRFAAESLSLNDKDELKLPFSLYAIHKELRRHNHTFSYGEIKEALFILNKSNIEITKVVEPGQKKSKPVVSASAFPVLVFKDENVPDEMAYLQLNPFLAGAIKSLAYEQVNYEWMMQPKGWLSRWLFKFVSLLLTEDAKANEHIELRASEIVKACGHSRSRPRDALSDIEKAVAKLQASLVIADFRSDDVMHGISKIDIKFTIRFSETFLKDRTFARSVAKHRADESLRLAGTEHPDEFLSISKTDAAKIAMDKRSMSAVIESELA